MCSSPRSTSRRAGFTLLEILVASTIFAVVLVLALTQIQESSGVTREATVQADLRRIGDDILARIVRDLRSTQSRYVSVSTTGDRIEFYRVVGFDVANQENLLDNGTAAGLVGPPLTNSAHYVYAYRQSGTDLEFVFDTRANVTNRFNGNNKITLCQELNPAATPVEERGLRFSAAQGMPGLVSTNVNFVFPDEPRELNIQLVLRRRVGKRTVSGNLVDVFAQARLLTHVDLKPSRAY